ncbi:MAG: hypothetical protein GAK30_01341 [Paracidovorax wautersii]|uniref:Acyl-CoA dehydrogenase/oxidase N-terminal domain-containing protein n=1 Tax=Paracidovorax wautersii TaxID=1177982 RepID=A0A7V8FQ68_9BURK|nr:MAG: hypothetical protein GAK30_01341 [Paracidovorax wautersii]
MKPVDARPDGEDWACAHADALDEGSARVDVLARFAQERLTRIGVPRALGGDGGTAADMTQAIADLARRSLTAAFMLWGHRCYAEYVVQSDNPALRERALPALLDGRHAGATGMSNAMKFLGGLEALQIQATPLTAGDSGQPRWRIDGRLPWVTHLRPGGFSVAAAVQPADGGPAPVFAFHASQPGVRRSDDLPLIALRGSQTAAVALDGVIADSSDRLHHDLQAWLPHVRPQFLGLQCGLSIGLAHASLAAARSQLGPARGSALAERIAQRDRALAADTDALLTGLAQGRFGPDPAALFRLRIALAAHAQDAVTLELQASGGRAYLQDQCAGFARRWREAAFIPVITPSLTQLETQLARQARPS